MSSGQSLRNGNSVEPGLPNTFLIPNARSSSKVAALTVRGVVEDLVGLRGIVCDPRYVARTIFTSPIGRGRHDPGSALALSGVPGEGLCFKERPYPLTPALSPRERE